MPPDPTCEGVPDPTAEVERECWPVERSTPCGEVEVGTGADDFEPLPDSLPFIIGNQGGVFIILNVRLRGLEPGSPSDLFAPGNPRSIITAYLADDTVLTRECPATIGFKPADDGYFVRPYYYPLEFIPISFAEQYFDTDIRIAVEVIDSELRYARDERTVRAVQPTGWGDAGPDGGIGPDAASL